MFSVFDQKEIGDNSGETAMSKLFKVMVSKVYYVEEIVKADDKDHALEIASEIVDEMECNGETFHEADWDAVEVSEDFAVTYEPIQEYLK